jgi:hypothetical protein
VSKPNSERIPFEPVSRPKKVKESKKNPSPPLPANKKAENINAQTKNTQTKDVVKPISNGSNSLGIPDDVNRRIARRVAIFCGFPTGLGITTFIVSYFLVSKHIVDLPTSAVVLLSMLFLGIGVVGLSYGAISASWDEGRVGSWWGGDEFKKNFGHLRGAWKSQQELVRASQQSKIK